MWLQIAVREVVGVYVILEVSVGSSNNGGGSGGGGSPYW